MLKLNVYIAFSSIFYCLAVGFVVHFFIKTT